MPNRSIVRPVLALLIATSFAACHKAPSTAASPSGGGMAARASNGMPAGVTLAMVAEGDSLFHARSCKNCHGADAKGATNGPDLTSGHFLHVNGSYDDFVRIITSGVPKDSLKVATHRPMGPRGGGRPPLPTDAEVRALAAYVYSLNHH